MQLHFIIGKIVFFIENFLSSLVEVKQFNFSWPDIDTVTVLHPAEILLVLKVIAGAKSTQKRMYTTYLVKITRTVLSCLFIFTSGICVCFLLS